MIKGLFDQGLMGIETSAEHGGSEMSFMAAIIAVEGKLCPSIHPLHICFDADLHFSSLHVNSELARVDPSVSVCMDVHNTLVNSTVRLFGSDYIKDKYLPGLATDTVSLIQESSGMMPHATDRDGDGDSLDRSA